MDIPVRAIIFDLDGTLVDSAGEIAAALDRTLDELRLPRLGEEEAARMIGRGVRVLMQRALSRVGARHVSFEEALPLFEKHYAQTIGTTAPLFPGVMAGLERLHSAGTPCAVVTNKPRFFTLRLLERLDIARFFACVVAGDDGIRQKPHGDMLVAACDALKSDPVHTLMLGDSDNDIAAAREAGCPVWCVPYGYNEGRPPESLRCDRRVATVDEAANLLTGFPSTRE